MTEETGAASPPYPNDSLRWVAVELRYPPIDEFATTLPAGFHDQIRDHFPIRENQTELSISLGPAGPSTQQAVRHRFLRRDRLMSLSVGRDAITLETTEYQGWTTIRSLFAEILRALETHRKPDGLVRIGLRYIDEIRIPHPIEHFSEWAGWIDDRLIAPFTLDEEPPANATIALQYGEPPGYVTLFKAAPFASGRTVLPEGVLRMPFETPDEAYFLLDTDGSWADPERQIPEFDVEQIMVILDNLHQTSKHLFEASLTPRLRNEVLSKSREEVWGA